MKNKNRKIQINYLKIKDLNKYEDRLKAMRLMILPIGDNDIKWLKKKGLVL